MEKNINNANELIGERKFDEAIELLSQLDKNPETYKLMGLCHLNMKDYKSAKNDFETVVKFFQNDATSWYYLALCYDNLDDYPSAKNAYYNVIDLRPKYLDGYKNLAVIHLKCKEEQKAIDIIEKAIEIEPKDYLLYYLAGSALLTLKEYEKSIEFFKKALRLNKSNVQLYVNYGTAYLSMREMDKALKMYKKAIEVDPSSPLGYYNAASIYQIQGKVELAIINFQKAYDLNNSEFFLSALALAQFKSGLCSQAAKHYEILSKKHPEKQNYRYNLICCYEQLGDLKTATKLLEQLVVFNPKSKIMVHKLASLYTENGQYQEAKRTYESLIANGIVSDEIYYDYAMICIKTNDIDVSERILKKVLELNPAYAKARKDLAVIYLNKRLFDYAKDEFEKAYKTAPDSPDIVFEYANFLQALGKNKEAKPLYEKAIELDSKNPNYYIFASLNAQILKEMRLAVKYVEAGLKLIPDDAFALLNAGKVYYAAKKYDKAQFVLIKSWELNRNPDVENLIGLTYFAQKEYEKALGVFEKLIKDFPTNTNILLSYAKVCEKSQKYDEAKDAANKILEVFDDMPEAKRLINRIKKLEKKV